MRELALDWSRQRLEIGLVPTMGALHEGHMSLVRRAREENQRVVVSVFVNPLQFGPGEDLDRYPRDLDQDRVRLAGAGVDAVFAPSTQAMYGAGAATRVSVVPLGQVLEAVQRPGHFEGVATVVTKLFNLCRPDRAYFGRKDAQQLALVQRLAEDLDFGLSVVPVATVRDPDGLALSSRNAYLSPAERAAAPCLWRALVGAGRAYRQGVRQPEALSRLLRDSISAEPLAELEYAELVDPSSFTSPGPLAVLAVRLGSARLIDNLRLDEFEEVS